MNKLYIFVLHCNVWITVCPDCPDNYNPEELTWALVTLGIVTSVFLSICFCRCYPKFKLIFLDNPADNVKLRCTNKSDRQTPINDFHNNQEALTKMEERCSCESQPSQSAPFGYKYAAHVPQRQLNLCQI